MWLVQYIYDKFLEALKNVPKAMFEQYLSPDVLKNKMIEYEAKLLCQIRQIQNLTLANRNDFSDVLV